MFVHLLCRNALVAALVRAQVGLVVATVLMLLDFDWRYKCLAANSGVFAANKQLALDFVAHKLVRSEEVVLRSALGALIWASFTERALSEKSLSTFA